MGETHTSDNGTKFPEKNQIIRTWKISNDSRKPGKVLSKGENNVTLSKEEHKTYR